MLELIVFTVFLIIFFRYFKIKTRQDYDLMSDFTKLKNYFKEDS